MEIRSLYKQILEDDSVDSIEKTGPNTFICRSSSGQEYNLKVTGTGVKCDCPGFKYRQKCRHMAMVQIPKKTRVPREAADQVVAILSEYLKNVSKYELAGSYRRGKSTIGDVDILAETDNLSSIGVAMSSDPEIEMIMSGPDIVRGFVPTTYGKVEFDFLRVNPSEWATYLLYRTGPKKLNIIMRAEAKKRGWRLNEHGLFDDKNKRVDTPTEQAVFEALGMKYLLPQEREEFV